MFNWQIRWLGIYNGKIISNILPQHNAYLAITKLQILEVSKIVLLPNMKLLDTLIAHNRLIISTKFLRILANSIANEQILLSAIASIQESINHKEFSAVLLDIVEYISYGNNFSAAICRHKAYFDQMLISQITIGEKTGNLLANLTNILTQRTAKIARFQTLKKNLIYPIFLLFIASSILMAFILLVIPTIYDAISELNLAQSPNLITMLNIASCLNKWLPMCTKLMIVIVLCYNIYPKHHKNTTDIIISKYYINKVIYYSPIIHNFYHLAFISLFANNLAMLLKSNIDIKSAFDILIALEHNLYLESKLKQAKTLIIKGFNLSNALNKTELLPNNFIAELHASEVANTVTSSLEYMAKNYTNTLEANITMCCKLMEPTIIIIVAFIIGSILLSVYIPLLGVADII
jgi:type IV pilus assembly protein PilC